MLTPRLPSPYGLIQEKFRDDPWRLLVCCIMLNLTSRRQAEPVWDRLFERWPTPASLYYEKREEHEILGELTEMLRPLGLQNRRAVRIWRMTADFLVVRPQDNPNRVGELHGVGKYAKDSFDMFVGGHVVDDVQDKELQRYVQWVRST